MTLPLGGDGEGSYSCHVPFVDAEELRCRRAVVHQIGLVGTDGALIADLVESHAVRPVVQHVDVDEVRDGRNGAVEAVAAEIAIVIRSNLRHDDGIRGLAARRGEPRAQRGDG